MSSTSHPPIVRSIGEVLGTRQIVQFRGQKRWVDGCRQLGKIPRGLEVHRHTTPVRVEINPGL